MKRTLIAIALLLCLALGTMIAAHVWVNSARDQVEVTETVLMGDPDAAAGAAITLRSRDRNGHLNWETTFTPGAADAAETAFRFSSKAARVNMLDEPRGELSQEFPLNIGIGGDIDLENIGRYHDAGYQLFVRLAAGVAERTAAGEERTETLRLIDYFDSYPLSFQANWSSMFASYDTESNGYLAKYFRIPVDPELLVEITVTKDSSGGVREITGNTIPTAPYIWSESVATEEGIYLVASTRNGYDRATGELQCRDGQGVHFVPLNPEEPDWFHPKGFRLFYPTDAEILSLRASADSSQLMLYTWESGKAVLTVVDRSSGEAVQRLELMDLPESGDSLPGGPIDRGELHLFFVPNGAFCLLREGVEGVSIVLTGTLDDVGSLLYEDNITLAWDGARMALACTDWEWELGTCLYTVVWDAEGLEFLGQYQFSHFRDPSAKGRFQYRTAEEEATSIQFS